MSLSVSLFFLPKHQKYFLFWPCMTDRQEHVSLGWLSWCFYSQDLYSWGYHQPSTRAGAARKWEVRKEHKAVQQWCRWSNLSSSLRYFLGHLQYCFGKMQKGKLSWHHTHLPSRISLKMYKLDNALCPYHFQVLSGGIPPKGWCSSITMVLAICGLRNEFFD